MSNHLNKICPVCGGDIILTALGQMCEQCHYMLPTPIAIQGYTGTALGKPELSPFTLHIKDCKAVKFDVNGIAITANFGDVDFSKYEAIEINGHRFERVVEDTRTPLEKLSDAVRECNEELEKTKEPNSKSLFCLNCPDYPMNGGSGNCSCSLGQTVLTNS